MENLVIRVFEVSREYCQIQTYSRVKKNYNSTVDILNRYAQFVPRLAGPIRFIFWPIVESILPKAVIRKVSKLLRSVGQPESKLISVVLQSFTQKFIGISPDESTIEESEMMYNSPYGMISVITAETPYVLLRYAELSKRNLFLK